LVALGIPAALNLNNYLRYTAWLAHDYASSDGGIFPAGAPRPSYFLSYFPENLGFPIFILGCLGLFYIAWVKDRRALLLIVVGFPLYVWLELSSVKVNRWALELMPMFCLLAALVAVRLGKLKPVGVFRIVSGVLFLAVISYSGAYAFAWTEVVREKDKIPMQAAEWVKIHVPEGNRIGMKAQFWIAGTPSLVPDSHTLSSYQIDDFYARPEYIILPKLLYALIDQYINLSQTGYQYSPQDWYPQPPPSPSELTVLTDIIRQKDYVLVQEFEVRPRFLNWEFVRQTFGGRTWFLEHMGNYGIQIYKNRTLQTRVAVASPRPSGRLVE
jgi:hypothetical protein